MLLPRISIHTLYPAINSVRIEMEGGERDGRTRVLSRDAKWKDPQGRTTKALLP